MQQRKINFQPLLHNKLAKDDVMKLNGRLGLYLSGWIVLMILLGVIFVFNHHMQYRLAEISDENMPKINIANELRDEVNQISVRVRDMILVNNPKMQEQNGRAVQQFTEKANVVTDMLKSSAMNEEEKELLNKILNCQTELHDGLQLVIGNLNVKNKRGATNALLDNLYVIRNNFLLNIKSFIEYENSQIAEKTEKIDAENDVVTRIIGFGMMLSIVVIVFFTFRMRLQKSKKTIAS